MDTPRVGIRILEPDEPVSPVDVGGWTLFYTHDCQVRGNRLWAACITDGILACVDVTEQGGRRALMTFTWAEQRHNCDLTADGRYLLTTDEATAGHLHVFDVSEPVNVRASGAVDRPTRRAASTTCT